MRSPFTRKLMAGFGELCPVLEIASQVETLSLWKNIPRSLAHQREQSLAFWASEEKHQWRRSTDPKPLSVSQVQANPSALPIYLQNYW